MRIAVNTRFLLSEYRDGYGYFLSEIFARIVRNHPEHEFIFIFDRPYDPKFVFSNNVKAIVVGPPARHPLLWNLWYNWRIPVVLKKYQADVFVSCDSYCSLRTKTPQMLVLHDLSFLHFPEFLIPAHRRFLRSNTPAFARKATVLATVSEFSKNDIVNNYGIKAADIAVINNAARAGFAPLGATEAAAVREQHTDGRQFFLYAGAIHPRKNLTNLLKAFSIFKKKQNSNFKLVIAGRLAWKYEKFVESLRSYKYRNDVILLGYVPDETLFQLMGAAYALVYPSYWEGFGVPVLEAMQSGTPVITSVNSSMEEIAGDAALYADPSSHEEIAEKMQLLYKDENLRARLIEKGIFRARDFSWDDAAAKCWSLILKAAGQTMP